MSDFKPGDRVRLDLNGESEFRHPPKVAPDTIPKRTDNGKECRYMDSSDFTEYRLVWLARRGDIRVHESQLRKA